jgi:hypothetical protein
MLDDNPIKNSPSFNQMGGEIWKTKTEMDGWLEQRMISGSLV